MTKKFEEVRRGTLGTLADAIAQKPPKGEIVVLIDRPRSDTVKEIDLTSVLKEAMETMSMRDAVAAITVTHGLPRRKVYQAALALQKE